MVWFVCWLDDEILAALDSNRILSAGRIRSIGELFAHIFTVVVVVFGDCGVFSSSHERVSFSNVHVYLLWRCDGIGGLERVDVVWTTFITP